MALACGSDGPAVIAVNPGSLLGTKMVKEAYCMAGGDVQIGAEILYRASPGDEFATASGQYFDNDSGHFSAPHHDARDQRKTLLQHKKPPGAAFSYCS